MAGGSPSEVGSFLASSLGAGGTRFGPSEFRATGVLGSPRFKELDRRQSYFDCTQNDYKEYDFDGRIISLPGPGAMAGIPLLNRVVAPFYVPLRGRRPSAPYRLARVIVQAFTAMVFGSQHFPTFKIEGDEDAQDFATQLGKSSKLSSKMIRARNIGGAVGTVGLSWCYDQKGRPRVDVHNGKYLYVHDWDDRDELVPAHVTEVYLTNRDEWDASKRKFVRNWYWHRRDWNENEDILFREVLYQKSVEPQWTPDPHNSITHGDGLCHFSWIQNMPSEEIDGVPDYEGLYEKFDQMDILLSVIAKGAILNLDPTLVLKMDRDIVGVTSVKKGSDNSLVVGEEGGAEYLELDGQSMQAGIALFNEMRRGALETSQAVILDPSEPTGPDVSSVAQRQKYSPMIAKADVFREQYGGGMQRIIDQMVKVAREKTGKKLIVYVKNDVGDDVAVEKEFFIALPPKVQKVPKVDDQGQPAQDETGKLVHEVQQVDRNPGSGGEIELQWPAYFPPTPADQQAVVTAASTAAGGKAVISQQTAVEKVAQVYDVEPDAEWDRVQKMNTDDQAQASVQANAFAGDRAPGGKVGGENEMPPGAAPKLPNFGGSKPPFGGTPASKAPDDQQA